MEIVAFVHKNAPGHPQWSQWYNRYLFDAPELIGRDQKRAWANSLMNFEASLHSPEVAILGVTILTRWGELMPSANSWQNTFTRTDASPVGFGRARGPLHYRYGLRFPYHTSIPGARGMLYHGCLGEDDVEAALLGGLKLRDAPWWKQHMDGGQGALWESHFSRLLTVTGGGGSIGGYWERVEGGLGFPHLTLTHATTRARLRNVQSLSVGPVKVLSALVEAANAIKPLDDYASSIAVDVVPLDVVYRGLGACGALYLLTNTLQEASGSSSEDDQSEEPREARYGATSEQIEEIAQALKQWFDTDVFQWTNTLQPYTYAGDSYFTDAQAAQGYTVLGKGLSIASRAVYIDWAGLKELKPGRAGYDPLPDVVELAM